MPDEVLVVLLRQEGQKQAINGGLSVFDKPKFWYRYYLESVLYQDIVLRKGYFT